MNRVLNENFSEERGSITLFLLSGARGEASRNLLLRNGMKEEEKKTKQGKTGSALESRTQKCVFRALFN